MAHPPVDLRVVRDIRSQIAADWLQILQRSQWRAYRKPPSLFRMVPSIPPMTSLPPKWGSIFPHDTRMSISPQQGHAVHFMLRFYGMVFRAPILYNTYRAVIFVIAQLSCLSLPRPYLGHIMLVGAHHHMLHSSTECSTFGTLHSRLKQCKHVLDFSCNPSRNLLEICSVKFVDTLQWKLLIVKFKLVSHSLLSGTVALY